MKKDIKSLGLILLCSISTIYSMEEKEYSSSKKIDDVLRNSKEKEKPNRHIERKKARRRLVSSKEEYLEHFVHEWEDDHNAPSIEKRRSSDSITGPKVRSRSGSFSITPPVRRSSTGQIDTEQGITTNALLSPHPLRRENSKGSIEMTPEKFEILENLKKQREITPEKLAKIQVLNNKQGVTQKSTEEKN